MLKLITIIYDLVLFFNISSDVRGMKISREKVVGHKLGGRGGGMDSTNNYSFTCIDMCVEYSQQ